MTGVRLFLNSLGPEVEDPEEEAFLLFSQTIPSQNLGFVDSKATEIDLTINGRDLTIHQSPTMLSSNRDGGTTGAVIWKITPLFAKWISLPTNPLLQHQIITPESVVLELGCGISGLIALTLSPLLQTYVLTDQPYILKLLSQNLSSNSPTPSTTANSKSKSRKSKGLSSASTSTAQSPSTNKIVPLTLDWETDVVSPSLTCSDTTTSFDAIIACDCIYNDALIPPLVQTCIDLCRLRPSSSFSEDGSQPSTPTLCVIAQQLRSPDVFESWLKEFNTYFRVWRVQEGDIQECGLGEDSGFVVHIGILRQESRSQHISIRTIVLQQEAMSVKFLLAMALVVTAVVVCRFFPTKYICKEKHTVIRDLQQATAILKSSTLPSRALPNQRLTRVFSICNAFTTTDQGFYKAFLTDARSLLKTPEESLPTLAREILALVQESSSSIPANKPTPLGPLIQVLCFRFAVLKFCPKTSLSPSSTPSILHITKLINSLWISSKRSDQDHDSQNSMQSSQLHGELNRLFPASSGPTHDNPLNILIPAYETLWRVVLRCFLEISSRRHASAVTAEWKDILEQFRANVTYEQFKERNGRCSLRDIVFESLRLYPPTRRIYRQSCESGAELLAVDVEYLQRTEEIWGVDGSEFRPDRWGKLERGEKTTYKEAWMPFGKACFQCPALNVAPMMIAMLVGGLVHVFGGGEWVLEEEGDGKEFLRGGPLDNGREALEGLRLKRVEVDGQGVRDAYEEGDEVLNLENSHGQG
ncbi:hypothetical protein DSL72_005343 [Monilinia vaccinii-corymbosi]|uniref:Uncharacterized protein n=1 Tax=Monilinia vaccinii-corymbosi TaxID=61207 RepID=A0A8A3PEX1_9HELO|nr:hypothetical protein DSL72_005343 [Monilinia vaccinii-corymbosi]